VTFKNVSGWDQPILAFNDAAYGANGFAAPNTSNVSCNHASATTTGYFYTGDVELNAKPTWMD
jgi:hypothetical protein